MGWRARVSPWNAVARRQRLGRWILLIPGRSTCPPPPRCSQRSLRPLPTACSQHDPQLVAPCYTFGPAQPVPFGRLMSCAGCGYGCKSTLSVFVLHGLRSGLFEYAHTSSRVSGLLRVLRPRVCMHSSVQHKFPFISVHLVCNDTAGPVSSGTGQSI